MADPLTTPFQNQLFDLGPSRGIRTDERSDFRATSQFQDALQDGLLVTLILGCMLLAYFVWEIKMRQPRPALAEPISPLEGVEPASARGGPQAAQAERPIQTAGSFAATTGLKLLWAIGAFVLTLIISGIAVSAVISLINGPRYRLEAGRFGGVVLGALLVAYLGWRRAPTPEQARQYVSRYMPHLGLHARLAIAVAVPWTIILLVAVYEFEWLGRYWYANQWTRFAFALVGPPLLVPAIVMLWRWALRRDPL